MDKSGGSAFMETFESIKDYETDFLDMQESNPQYEQVFKQFGLVFKDLIYNQLRK